MPDVYQQRLERLEAAKLTKDNADELAQWCGGLRVDLTTPEENVVIVSIQVTTLGELITALEGDYIVRRSDGRWQTASADTFESMYELVPTES
jgi:hypothetical protein